MILCNGLRLNYLTKKELGFKALSMVVIDYDFNGEYLDVDDMWFASDLEKNNYEGRFLVEKIKHQMMIIYTDVFGNKRK